MRRGAASSEPDALVLIKHKSYKYLSFPQDQAGRMIVNCPNCATRFTLPDGALGTAGRRMKCARCGHKWHEMPPQDEAEAAPDDTWAEPEPAPAAAPASDVPLEMEPGAPAGRAAPPDAGDIPMESAPGQGGLQGRDDDTTDLDALADMLSRDDDFNADQDDGDADGRAPDLDSLINADDPDDIPSMFASPEDEEDDGRRKRRWPAVLVVLLIVIGGLAAGAWFGRQQIIAWVPQAQGLYAMTGLPVQSLGAGLRFQNVAGERIVEDGVDTLIVRGFIANIADSPREIPHLKLTLYDAEDKPVQSMVSRPPQPTVEAETNTGFRLTLENPPASARRFEVDWTAAPAPNGTSNGPGPAIGGDPATGAQG